MPDRGFWESRWKEGETGWDIGRVSPPIQQYIDTLKDKKIKILIPGAGNAYEAKYLINNGFENVTVVDIAENLIEKLKKDQSKSLNLICSDFFDLQEKYDLIIEQTFFCALDPNLREDYVTKMHELLHQNGKLVGVLFNRNFDGGPPFGGNMNEYKELFSKKFDKLKIENCYNSIAERSGSEVWLVAEKK